MFDHVTIYVPDREASAKFFDTVLVQLGIETSYRTNDFSEYDDFSLTHEDASHPRTSGLHIGFAAPTREHVDAFWRAGVDGGYESDGPPGPRTEYLPDYYGSFLRSPDGNSIEAVHYSDVPQRRGIVDHLWIRVRDLEASTAFYRELAASLGFDFRHADGRTTLHGPDGGSFSLLEGEPTQHVHMAFPTDNAGVERFHANLTAAGHPDNGAPGERPRYHPGYYAAYVSDPDGHNIEAVNHNRT
jgi:catechol 2,3-dioxygenase-like lactoylglutathione lyase family enzyme